MKNALVEIYPKHFPHLSPIFCSSFAALKSTEGRMAYDK